jgi:hypothetical protein
LAEKPDLIRQPEAPILMIALELFPSPQPKLALEIGQRTDVQGQGVCQKVKEHVTEHGFC